MKEQARIDFRTRRSRITRQEPIKVVKKVEGEQPSTRAFRAAEEPISKPSKIEKTTVARKSSRIASKEMKQTVLVLKKKEPEMEAASKRKLESNQKQTETIKKQKQTHEAPKQTESIKKQKQTQETSKQAETVNVDASESEVSSTVVDTPVVVDTPATETLKEVNIKTVKAAVLEEPVEKQEQPVVAKKFETEEKLSVPTIKRQETEESYSQDTPSPPSSSFIEPTTPPASHTPVAPFKEYMSEADKERIDYEKTTLTRLRKSLDIVITDRTARNLPALYHQIEPSLRNSTHRTITLSHVCKVMYVAPRLYTVEAKELRSYGGKVTEAFLIQFGNEWKIPLSGKDLQQRADMLSDAVNTYFDTHPEHDASIPESPLPRLSLVVDKKQWLDNAKLPPGVRSLLEAHERVKQEELEKQKPKPKPTGSVKDRMAALRARLAKKNGSS